MNAYEEQKISKTVWKLGIPAMLGSLTTLVYNIADTYFVALTKEPAMIAAVTLCAPILLICMSIACIFGMGGSSVIARMIGEGRKKDSAGCFRFCTYAMGLAGILVLVLGLLFERPIAGMIGADTENFEYTCSYLRWIFIGAPALMLANGLVHAFRSIGLVKEATIGLALGNGMNIILDWILIVICRMGTQGAAMATSLGFVCASIYYIFVLIHQERKQNEYVKLSPGGEMPEKRMAANVIRIGIPGALITVMLSVSNIVLNNFIGRYSSDAVASYGIAYKVEMFPILILVGLSQGTAPLMGYFFGQKKEEKLAETVKTAAIYGILIGAAFTLIIFFGNTFLADIFLDDPILIRQAGWFLRLLCINAPFLGVINIVTSYFQALGKARSSLMITLLRNVVLFLPGVILLNHFFRLNGVMVTQAVVEMLVSVICVIMYLHSSPKKMVEETVSQ